MSFFVESTIVWVEFTGQMKGWKVALKSEMDAGDQEELEKAMMGIEADGAEVKPKLSPGSLRLLELNILKIVDSTGKEITPTPELLRKLHRGVLSRLLAKIREMNRPLAELELMV